MNNKEQLELIINQIKNEIKIDTDTGVGYCSIRGVGRLCDVSISTMLRHFSKDSKNKSKLRELLEQYSFSPDQFSSTGVPDLALSIIVKYYAYLAGERCTETAQLLDLIFSGIGSRQWMKDIVGYGRPFEERFDPRAFLLSQVRETPSVYTVRFTQRFWVPLERLYGLKQGQKGCAPFINAYIYNYFPVEVN